MQYYRGTTTRIRPIICPLDSQKNWQCDYIIPSYDGYSHNYSPIFTRAYPICRQVSIFKFPFPTLLKNYFLLLGQSVYWQSIFQKSADPTLVLLTFIWHTVYAWDEALETLYSHICTIVSHTILHRVLIYSAYVGV